jgi:RNA polymerase sigma-70 factor (ECF subfamily)
VALSEIDRHLLERCLARKPRAWEDFIDRYMGLVVHVVNHCAQARSIRLTPDDRDDLCADVFFEIVRDDSALLRRFRGHSSLATYLTVVARRVVVRRLIEQKSPTRLADIAPPSGNGVSADDDRRLFENRQEVERLLDSLNSEERQLVRLYHLDGKSYQQISAALGVPENSVGPMLSRARQKMREAERAR